MNSRHASPTTERTPVFSSVEEEAAFWDSHDTGTFDHEFEPAEVEVARPLAHSWEVVTRFDEMTFRRIQAVAQERGISLATLAHQWLIKALERSEREAFTPGPDQQ